jgi:hypothetical protein
VGVPELPETVALSLAVVPLAPTLGVVTRDGGAKPTLKGSQLTPSIMLELPGMSQGVYATK